jgi:signal peptidase I
MSETPDAATAPVRRRWRRWTLIGGGVVVALITLGAAAHWAVRSYTVPGDSMTPTIQPGDHVVVDRVGFRLTGLRRGDLVLVRNPEIQALSVDRLAGLPGDRISCRHDVLYRNGAPADEPYLKPGTKTMHCSPVTVGPGQVFLLGDHRSASADSRFFGPLGRDRVEGRVLSVVR